MTNVTMLVHNRAKLTGQALDSLGPTKNFSVTILTDSSDDAADYAVGYTYNKRAKCVETGSEDNLGTGSLRNMVIKQSEEIFGRGDYLYLSDNDVFFKPGWLETLIACYEESWKFGYRILGAYNHPYHQHVGEPLLMPSTHPKNSWYRTSIREVEALALQSMIMRWSVWDQYGPFDETAPGKVCQGEDTYFAHRITAAGYKLGVVDPPLLVNTGITNSFGERIPGWELVKAQCPEGVICE